MRPTVAFAVAPQTHHPRTLRYSRGRRVADARMQEPHSEFGLPPQKREDPSVQNVTPRHSPTWRFEILLGCQEQLRFRGHRWLSLGHVINREFPPSTRHPRILGTSKPPRSGALQSSADLEAEAEAAVGYTQQACSAHFESDPAIKTLHGRPHCGPNLSSEAVRHRVVFLRSADFGRCLGDPHTVGEDHILCI